MEMKKYVRTKNQVREYEKVINSIKYRYKNVVMEAFDKSIIKQADTIEELCDEFVFDGGDVIPLFCTYEELIYWFNHSKEQQYKIRNCYGAIWTNKGLIYVAKLNKDGVLELI